jgi:hypothetical protein
MVPPVCSTWNIMFSTGVIRDSHLLFPSAATSISF